MPGGCLISHMMYVEELTCDPLCLRQVVRADPFLTGGSMEALIGPTVFRQGIDCFTSVIMSRSP